MTAAFTPWDGDALCALPSDFVMVLMAMGRHIGPEATCWTSLKTLASKLGISPSAVSQRIARMRASGIIEVTQRQRADGGRTTNLYRVAARLIVPLKRSPRRRQPDGKQREMMLSIAPVAKPTARTIPPLASCLRGHTAQDLRANESESKEQRERGTDGGKGLSAPSGAPSAGPYAERVKAVVADSLATLKRQPPPPRRKGPNLADPVERKEARRAVVGRFVNFTRPDAEREAWWATLLGDDPAAADALFDRYDAMMRAAGWRDYAVAAA